MSRKKSKGSFVVGTAEVASGVGLLALFSYSAGYMKLYFLYRALGCEWAVSFHSFQEIVSKGVTDVLSCSIVAILAFYSARDIREADGYGLRGVGIFLMGVAIPIFISRWLGFSITYIAYDGLMFFCYYGLMGIPVAAAAREFVDDGEHRHLAMISICFIVISIIAPLHYYSDQSINMLSSGNRFQFLKSSKGEKGILLSSISGRYLVKLCSSGREFKIVSQTDDWVIGSAEDKLCK